MTSGVTLGRAPIRASRSAPNITTTKNPVAYLAELFEDIAKVREMRRESQVGLKNLEKILKREIRSVGHMMGFNENQVDLLEKCYMQNRAIMESIYSGQKMDPRGFFAFMTSGKAQGDVLKVSPPPKREDVTTLFEKIPIPNDPNNNLIGRILGPCGLTIRQLERDSGCVIRIKGKGSVKNPVRAARLRGRVGWEHLDEPLHVHVLATDPHVITCVEKLKNGVKMIKALMTATHDQQKQQQLLQHALINASGRFDAGESDETTGTTTTTTTSTTRTTGTTGQTTGTRRGSNQTTCTDDGTTTTTTTTNTTQTVFRVKAVDGVAGGNFDLTQWENTRFEEDAQEMAGMKMNPKQEEKGAVMANNTVTMKSSIQERKKISKKKFVATLAAYSSLSIYCSTNESKIDWWLNSFIIFNTSAIVISLFSSICFEATRLLIEKEAQGDEEPIPYKCEVFACAVTLLRCSLFMANLVLFIFGHNIHFSIYVLCAIAVLCSYVEVVMTVIRAKTKK